MFLNVLFYIHPFYLKFYDCGNYSLMFICLIQKYFAETSDDFSIVLCIELSGKLFCVWCDVTVHFAMH